MNKYEEELTKLREHKAALKTQIQATEIQEAILNNELAKEGNRRDGYYIPIATGTMSISLYWFNGENCELDGDYYTAGQVLGDLCFKGGDAMVKIKTSDGCRWVIKSDFPDGDYEGYEDYYNLHDNYERYITIDNDKTN
jgi:hypothetical protein